MKSKKSISLLLVIAMLLSLTFVFPQEARAADAVVTINQSGNGADLSAADFANLLNKKLVTNGSIYTLTENITIDASQLTDDYFKSNSPVSTDDWAIFQSSIDGGGNKITITDDLSFGIKRSLLGQVGFRNYSDHPEPLFIKDLSIEYNGDVPISGFAQGSIYNTNLENISVKVNGDIVAGKNRFWAGYTVGHAYGLAQEINVTATPNVATSKVNMTGITIDANCIGTKMSGPAVDPDTDYSLQSVSGLANTISWDVNMRDININVDNLYAHLTKGGSSGTVVSGLADSVFPQSDEVMKNININIKEDMQLIVDENFKYAVPSGGGGLFGIAENITGLHGINVHIGGDVIGETSPSSPNTLSAYGDSMGFVGFGMANTNLSGIEPMSAPQITDNTLTVDGDIKISSAGDNYVVLGAASFGSVAKDDKFSSKDNTVHVKGNLTQENPDSINGSHSVALYGMMYGMRGSQAGYSSINDHVRIDNNVKVYHNTTTPGAQGSAYFIGHSVNGGRDSSPSSTVSGSSVTVGGDVAVSTEGGNAVFYGFQDGRIEKSLNNQANYLGNVSVKSNGISNKDESQAFGFASNVAGGVKQSSQRKVSNNSVYVAGDMSVEANRKAKLTGFLYSSPTDSAINDNIVKIDGKLKNTVESTTTDASIYPDPGTSETAGFARQTRGPVEKNAVSIAGGMDAKVNSGGSPQKAGLLFVTDNMVKENTLFGKPGTQADGTTEYGNMVSSPIGGADCAGNFFTSMMAGQRTTNEMKYNSTSREFEPVSKARQPRMIVTSDNEFTTQKNYVTSNEFTNPLQLKGTAASNSTLIPKADSKYDLQLGTTSVHPITKIVTTVNGKEAALDIPGVGHANPCNKITGTIMTEDNKSVSGVTINVRSSDNELIDRATTNQQGQYSLDMPLTNCVAPENILELVAPSGYNISKKTHDFTSTGSTKKVLSYIDDNVFNGLLSKKKNKEPNPELQGDYYVTFNLSDKGNSVDPLTVQVKHNQSVESTPKVKPNDGYVFRYWSLSQPTETNPTPTKVDPLSSSITRDTVFYAVYIEGDEHQAYLVGDDTGTFRPESEITRAEVAMIFARTLTDGFREDNDYGDGGYSDMVETDHWGMSGIAYCSTQKIFEGTDKGTFEPDRQITREEFMLALARVKGVETSGSMPFTDVGSISDWALDGVYTNFKNGWVQGFVDNTMRPQQQITRGEVTKIVNMYLNRGVDAEGLADYDFKRWPDVPTDFWAYHHIIEATTDHMYIYRDEVAPPEDWIPYPL